MLREAHRTPKHSESRRGFTVVELLVVVAVIAVLLSILLPSLSIARQRAKCVVCAAQLRQWGVAFACYAVENNSFWPHCDGLDREDYDPADPDFIPPNARPWRVANWFGWVDALPPLMSHKKWRHHGTRKHPKERTIYQCPTARLPEDRPDYNERMRLGYFSYAMNSCLELDRGAWRPPGGDDFPMPSFLDTAKLVAPARVVLLFDQLLDPRRGYGGDVPLFSAGEHCGSYPIAFAARHRRGRDKLGGNILSCDGHAHWQSTVWKDVWGEWNVGSQQAPPRDDLNWYPYPLARAP